MDGVAAWVVEELVAGGDGGAGGEDEVRLAGFGAGVEGVAASVGEQRFEQPFGVVVFGGPELGPVDQVRGERVCFDGPVGDAVLEVVGDAFGDELVEQVGRLGVDVGALLGVSFGDVACRFFGACGERSLERCVPAVRVVVVGRGHQRLCG